MMGDEFDSFRELSDKNLAKLRTMAEANPKLTKSLQMYEQISGRNLSVSAREAQEENDRRWEKLEADLGKEQQPRTMGAFSDMLEQFGFKLPTPVPDGEMSKEGLFGEFMNTYGSQGVDVVSDYKMKKKKKQDPDDQQQQQQQQQYPKCEECGKVAAMKCTQCGERYCSRVCQKKAWPGHKPVCKVVTSS